MDATSRQAGAAGAVSGGPAPSAPALVQRIFYLDALRAFAMFYGILVHSATIGMTGRGSRLFDIIIGSSDLFRMAAFFLISGYFTAMACARMEGAAYWRSRADVLVVPLLSSLILLAPLTNWLVHRFHNGPVSLADYLFRGGWRAPTAGNDVWHLHFWFLFSLIVFAAVTPPLAALVRSPRLAGPLGRLCERHRTAVAWLAIVATGIAAMLGTAAFVVILEPLLGSGPFAWIARATLAYAPFFALGVLAHASPPFFAALHRVSMPALLLFGSLFAWIGQARDALPFALGGMLAAFAKAALVASIVMALLALFRHAVRAPSRIVSLGVNTSYTVYLFHLTAIYTLANLLLPLSADRLLLFALIVPSATALLVLWHLKVIAPNPSLRFLFNGRRAAVSAPSPGRT